MKKHKKLWIAAATMTIAAGSVLGTFAWQSISQDATNKAIRLKNPGGRLHDDFNGSDKDVYVENYRDDDDGGVIFARIRLSEYLEIGEGAGEDPTVNTEKKAVSIIVDENVKYDDETTWYIHNPYDDDEPFHNYFTWTEGGQTMYMPTFNKDNESLQADINGTLEGGISGTPYGDYEDYKIKTTETEYEIHDGGVKDSVQQTHTAQNTLEADVITMDEWKAKGCPKGNYWVYDKDGWAYWADAIWPNTATGCLINEITPKASLNDNYFYGIHVEAQLISGGEWQADEETDTYYYAVKDPENEKASRDAIYLLEIASGNVKTIKISSDTLVAEVGQDISIKAKVSLGNLTLEDEGVKWSLSGNTSASTTIDSETGSLHVGNDELSKNLTVTATLKSNTAINSTYSVYTNAPAYTVSVTSNETITARNSVVAKGNTMGFSAKVTRDDGKTASQSVTWKLEAYDAFDNPVTKASGTTINASGQLTVDANETAAKLVIKAISTIHDSIQGSYTVNIVSQMDYIPYIQVGTTETVSIDGYTWYVLAKDGNKYLLWSKESYTSNKFRIELTTNTTYRNYTDYRVTNVNAELETQYSTLLPTLSKKVQETTVSVATMLTDVLVDVPVHVFALSEADYFGTHHGIDGSVTEADSKEYTYRGKIVTSEMLEDSYNQGSGIDYGFTRSIYSHKPTASWGAVNYGSKEYISAGWDTTSIPSYAQMALWVEIK